MNQADVLVIHFMVVDDYFSDLAVDRDQRGVMSPPGLLSAISEPQQTFGGVDLYPDVLSKAAALLRSLILNHPFHNGNKRTAILSTVIFLEMNGYQCCTTRKKRQVENRLLDLATRLARMHEDGRSRQSISLQRIRDKWLKKLYEPAPQRNRVKSSAPTTRSATLLSQGFASWLGGYIRGRDSNS